MRKALRVALGLVAIAAVLANVELNLANHPAPLAAMVEPLGDSWAQWIALFSLMAVTNGALAQIVMSSRVSYGLSQQGQGPGLLASVHPRTQTPLTATVLMTGIVLIFALWLPLLTLARVTSFVVLMVFVLVNLALVRLKLKGAAKRSGLWVPCAGALLSAGLLAVSFAE